MTNDPDSLLQAPECMKEETRLISGTCSKCGKEVEFFSVVELHNAKFCPHCKEILDTDAIANKAGISR